MQIRDRQRFVELLALHGLSQRKLAELAHVSQAFISLLSHGRRGARPETAWRIASALGVLTEELFVSKTAKLEKATATPVTSTPPITLATTRPPVPQRSTRFLTRHRPHWERAASRTHGRQPRRPLTCRTMAAAA
ncbi:helix-turn-helix domain-containing protein [Streptomyces noursei]|uniref:helix-turn-helix transcriptional regulator n=1 Tax=Streptomyces noursei TaxID=1971 RepID=UPI000C9C1784